MLVRNKESSALGPGSVPTTLPRDSENPLNTGSPCDKGMSILPHGET